MADEHPTRNMLPLFTWRSGVMHSELPAMTKFVALALSLHMNEMGGSCFPSASTLCEETSLGRSTVWASLKSLQEQGWLVVLERGGLKGKSRRANVYQARTPIQEMDWSASTYPGDRARPVQDVDTSTSINSSSSCVRVVDRSGITPEELAPEQKAAAKKRAGEALRSLPSRGELGMQEQNQTLNGN